jgi:hypothetical protein
MPKPKNKYDLLQFEWILENGPSAEAITALRNCSPRHPDTPPGEASFIDIERKFYTQFLDRPIEQVSDTDLTSFLFDMTLGLNSFPDVIQEHKHWIHWFKYLLPFVIKRSDERLLELAITTFIRVFADQIDTMHGGLRVEALETVGQALMQPYFWPFRDEKVSPGLELPST